MNHNNAKDTLSKGFFISLPMHQMYYFLLCSKNTHTNVLSLRN